MFNYKNGFYVIPYLANDPYHTLESFKKLPFLKWNEEERKLTTNSLFIEGEVYYYEIEEGLWLL
ncbi:MAG: hypothetical protein HY062_17035, partial [Bacteroidetes bacterium]|nr:hypothetical protein [Bacteroidota bacterium]